jgi:Domain of unknown function (DUF4272)
MADSLFRVTKLPMDDPSEDSDVQFHPPTAFRVAARALVLAVTSCRGFVERDDAAADGNFWRRVRNWFSSLDIDAELEPAERALIEKPLGSLNKEDCVNATWSCEGMAVLAWALGCFAMPPYDEMVMPSDVADTLGFLKPRPKTVLANATLQSASEIEAFYEEIFGIHWRLREFHLRARPIDFASVAERPWFGPKALNACRLVDGDLAIGAVRIDKADPVRVQKCLSIAGERHRAANWLHGDSELFSEVETNT